MLPVVKSRSPRQPAAHPKRHGVAGVGGQNVTREDARESRGIRRYGVGDVRVVVPIARRRLNQRGLPDSGPVLLHDQLPDADGTLLRPGRLMPAERRTRILV